MRALTTNESVTVKRTIVQFRLGLKCASVLEEVAEVGSPFHMVGVA